MARRRNTFTRADVKFSRGPLGVALLLDGGGWRIFMMIVSMILFWGLIIGGIVLLVRFIFPSLDGKSPTNALETLKARYTKGKLPKNSLNR
jgi:putative membrane protein